MKPIDEKISAFVKRYVKAITPEEMEQICERNLKRLQATLRAEEEAKATVEEKIHKLTPQEYRILNAVYLLGGEGYGVTVRLKIRQMSDVDLGFGTIYSVLGRMERKGMVTTREADPTPERGWRAKRYFTVTDAGALALAHARENEEWARGGLRERI